MFFEEEEEEPSRPIPKVTIVSAPGKPPRPGDDDWTPKPVSGEGGAKDRHQTTMEPCVVPKEGEDELEDPKERLKICCGNSEECSKLREKLQTCNERVSSRTETMETCVEELFDFIHCVDHCVTKSLFAYLK